MTTQPPPKEIANMNRLLLSLAACACLATAPAMASDAYRASIEGCENAIATQLGVSDQAVSYNLQKVKSSARHRDLNFSVSMRDSASPVQKAQVSCRAQKNGDVLTVAFADPSLLPAVATH
jgi:hypothetical protein